jgi:hypothetical protein
MRLIPNAQSVGRLPSLSVRRIASLKTFFPIHDYTYSRSYSCITSLTTFSPCITICSPISGGPYPRAATRTRALALAIRIALFIPSERRRRAPLSGTPAAAALWPQFRWAVRSAPPQSGRAAPREQRRVRRRLLPAGAGGADGHAVAGAPFVARDFVNAQRGWLGGRRLEIAWRDSKCAAAPLARVRACVRAVRSAERRRGRGGAGRGRRVRARRAALGLALRIARRRAARRTGESAAHALGRRTHACVSETERMRRQVRRVGGPRGAERPARERRAARRGPPCAKWETGPAGGSAGLWLAPKRIG